MAPRLLIGTQNQDKIREFRHALEGLNVELADLSGHPDAAAPVEDGDTLEANACKKALHYAAVTRRIVVSDDSGLEVKALGGRPGVHSSRYAGEKVTYEQNNLKLLSEMEGIPEAERGARFRCVVAVAAGNRILLQVEGACEGKILTEMRGEGGFGFDPLFYLPGQGKTFAEMELDLKNRLSHRAKALAKLAAELSKILRAIES